jgi:putative SOS response-associated peptidase YedK
MCGRFTLTTSPADLAAHFDAPPEDADALRGLAPRYNVAPGQDVATVVAGEARRRLARKRWGLVPPWARDPSFGSQAINARVESVDRRPAFREAFVRRRCLVPADGFYEWRARGRLREPYHVALPGRRLFAMAALHERWRGPGGDALETCAVLTGPAHASLRALHDRMPLLVPPDHWAAWLDAGVSDPASLRALLDPELAAGFEVRAVDARVNSPRFDDPACLAPARQLGLFQDAGPGVR